MVASGIEGLTQSSSSLELLNRFKELQKARFDRADKDDSGGLSFREFAKARAHHIEGRELSAALPKLKANFARLDKDKSGELSFAELTGDKPGPRPGPPKISPRVLTELLTHLSDRANTVADRREAAFNTADTDQSGGLSLEEFSAARDARLPDAGPAVRPSNEEVFARKDRDGDGELTLAEIGPGRAKMRLRHALMSLLLEQQEIRTEADQKTNALVQPAGAA